MREHGKKSFALIDGKMVRFAQQKHYDAWFEGELSKIDEEYEPSDCFTMEQVKEHLKRHREIRDLRSKVTRKRK
jgi:hypothetical protein